MQNKDIRAFSVNWNDEDNIRKLKIILDEREKEIREKRIMDAYKRKHPLAISAPDPETDLQKIGGFGKDIRILREILASLGVSTLSQLLAYKKSDLESRPYISLSDRRNIDKFLWKNFGVELKD
jgi:predicted flap endonuclease-1-like 5' DNA nuclease